MDAAPSREPSPLLVAAIVAVPAVFGWLLLRSGYARSTRIAALTYGVGSTLISLLAPKPF